MQIAIQLPDDVAKTLRERWDDLERHVLEATVAQAYRQRILTSKQVAELLNLPSRCDAEELLRRHGADIGYDSDDLHRDLATLGSAG